MKNKFKLFTFGLVFLICLSSVGVFVKAEESETEASSKISQMALESPIVGFVGEDLHVFQERTEVSKGEKNLATKVETPSNVALLTSQWGTSNVSLDDSTGILTVGAGELVAHPSTMYIDNADTIKKSDVKEIVLEAGVVAPVNSSYLFSSMNGGFDKLTTIRGKLDTSQVTTMERMFVNTSNLTSLDVSNWDTSKVTNMSQMFYRVDIATLDTSNWDTSSVINMESMFAGATKVASLEVSNWDTSQVIYMGHMFSNTSSLTSLDVSSWDTSQVIDMSSMFSGASNLTSLDTSNWNTRQVTDMAYMFNYTPSLTTLNVANWDTSRVTRMSSMFAGATKLASLEVNNWDTSHVISMDSMFNTTTSLMSLEVSNWDTSQVIYMLNMFSQTNLSELDLSDWDTSQVTNMNGMFFKAKSLTKLNLSGWDTSQVTDMKNMFESDFSNLKELILGNKSIFNDSALLASIPTLTGEYTGKWERISPVSPISVYDSSDGFMKDYDGTMPGTYVWQRASYSITYELDGGTNNLSNPIGYTNGTGVSSFENATKTGYNFLGWYDASGSSITSISAIATGNKTLYAKWSKVTTSDSIKQTDGSDKVLNKESPSILPQTGDSNTPSALLILLAGLLISGGYLISKRKKL